MNELSSTTSAAHPAGSPARPKLVYHPPRLTVYGQVAALTQSNGCSATSDSTTACTPGAMNGAMAAMSDRRVKQDIVQVGWHPIGFGLYLFRYKAPYRNECGHGRQLGVMADEVERFAPQAVTTRPSGLKAVDYHQLGIRRYAH